MHCRCRKTQLVPAINFVEKAVATQPTIPITAGIYLKATDGAITLRSTNLELSIRTSCTADVFSDGELVVDGRLLASILRKLPDEEMQLQRKEQELLITAGTTESTFPILNSEQFPTFPDSGSEQLSIPSQLLHQLISNTVFATSKDESRPILMGVNFHLTNSHLHIAATDTSRLAYIGAPTPETSMEFNVTIPPRALIELHRNLDDDISVTISYHGDDLLFTFDSTTLATRLIDGQYPNYRALFPTNQPTKIHIKKQILEDSVERALLLNAKGQVVVLQASDGVLEIRTPPSTGSRFREELSVDHQGENSKAAFSGRYILDMLRATDTENVIIEFNEDLRSALLRPANTESQLYVLMPIRLSI